MLLSLDLPWRLSLYGFERGGLGVVGRMITRKLGDLTIRQRFPVQTVHSADQLNSAAAGTKQMLTIVSLFWHIFNNYPAISPDT